jgi:hypothetical protein
MSRLLLPRKPYRITSKGENTTAADADPKTGSGAIPISGKALIYNRQGDRLSSARIAFHKLPLATFITGSSVEITVMIC